VVDQKNIMKAILEKIGPITITESDLKESQGDQIGLIEQWDDKGNRTWTIYAHQGRIRK
jgi:hypothetical protein